MKKIARSTSKVSAGILFSRITGYFRDMTIASFFGANYVTDAFFLAFMIPNLLRRLFAEGALSAAFVPIFTDVLNKNDINRATEFASKIITLLLIITGIITLLGIIFSGTIINIFGYGFENIETKLLASKLLKIMFPLIIFISAAAVTAGILNIFRSFFYPAVSPALINLSIIVSILFFGTRFGTDLNEQIIAAAVGVLFGSVLLFFFQYVPLLIKTDIKLRLAFDFKDKNIYKTLLLMLPAIPALAVNQINIIIDRIIASFLNPGSISYLFYGNRLMQFPLALFGISIGIVVLPTVSKLISTDQKNKINKIIVDALGFMFFFIFPAAVGFYILGIDIISVLFKHGKFTDTHTIYSYIALKYYLIGLFGYAGVNILSQVFYSLKDTVTPLKIAACSMILNILLNVIFVYFWTSQDTKFAGIALATSITGIVNFVLLLYKLKKKIAGLGDIRIIKSVIKIIIAGLIMGFVCYCLNRYFDFNLYLKLPFVISLGAASYIILCYFMKLEQLYFVVSKLKVFR